MKLLLLSNAQHEGREWSERSFLCPLLVDLDVRLLRDLAILVDFSLLKGRQF
ncbi:hypothetical protein LP417_12300 [Polaromonas sp. P1-6]|nr:hypothetical protein LP417_12300 [Polaromonas sp. P1-6]